jgi:serine/threonine protein kinase
MHQNQIAHRDIKSLNILLDQYDRIKLIDFGFSQQYPSNLKTKIHGTRMFLSPEMWDKADQSDLFLADIYSLGVTFYFMSQGKYPDAAFSDEDFKKLVFARPFSFHQDIDLVFQQMVCQMMELNPQERPTLSQLLCNPIFQETKVISKEKQNSMRKMKTNFVNYASNIKYLT